VDHTIDVQRTMEGVVFSIFIPKVTGACWVKDLRYDRQTQDI
jgi:hypothetical protein